MLFHSSNSKPGKHLNLPFLMLFLFPFYFTYNLYAGNVYYAHDAYAGMYFPFRQWFLDRLMNFEFPLWNPFWGTGHEAVIWSTIPVDLYTILEIFLRPHYEYFFLIHCITLIIAGYYVFKKWNFDPWAATIGSLFFYISPLTTYWSFQFVNTNTFISHMFVFLFMVKWFETCQYRYVFLMGWSFFLGMFGTKLEFWFFEVVFYIILSAIAFLIMRPRKASMVLMVWVGIFAAILAQSWQINLLLNALNNSKRLAIPHGVHNLFSSEMYTNLYMSIGDSDLVPLIFIGILLFISLHSNSRTYRWFFLVCSIFISLLFKLWSFSFFPTFLKGPVLFGGILATVLLIYNRQGKYILSTWILFMLPAYYWCKPMVGYDETHYLMIAPMLFKGVWSFLVWIGCFQVHRYRTAQLAYLSIIAVLILEAQGQIIFSYLFGFVWIGGRDAYLIDFSFTIMAVFGTLTYFWFKPIFLRLIPFIIAFAAYSNLLYTLPLKPIPPYANPLLTSKLSYNPYTGVPGIKEIISKFDYLPYRRMVDPDIDKLRPQNQGTFLLEKTGNVAFYGSMTPARFDELIDFWGYGITPEDNVAGYPSVFGEKTISRLPKVNTKGFSNGFIYYLTQWTIPPFELDSLRLLGVDYIVTRDDGLLPSLIEKLKLSNVMKFGEFNVAKLSDTLPRSFLVLNAGQGNLRDFKENMRPVVEMADGKTSSSSNVYLAKPANILKYKPEYVEIQVKSSSEGHLVLTDVFHPYWSASVDGNATEIIPAFHAFRAVKVPAGSHRVEFFCTVPYFKLAFLVSFIIISFSLIFTIYFWNKGRFSE